MCLEKMGYKAISYTGWQLPILTNSNHSNARIIEINTKKIKESLKEGKIVIVAGFQGITKDGDITTLGRGGSDTTAVALAAALKAEKCDIYTDVEGVYTSDPRITENVVKIKTISYDEMLELASLGAKVLHNRCVEIGKKCDIPIFVKSTFQKDSQGTKVSKKEGIEEFHISGISKEDNITKISLNLEDNKSYNVFSLLAKNDVNIDMISQSIKDITFTIKEKDLNNTINILNTNAETLKIREIKYYSNLSKVSVVGIGIMTNPSIIGKIFGILCENDIYIHMITTSEIKISILVDNDNSENLLNKIHSTFIK